MWSLWMSCAGPKVESSCWSFVETSIIKTPSVEVLLLLKDILLIHCGKKLVGLVNDYLPMLIANKMLIIYVFFIDKRTVGVSVLSSVYPNYIQKVKCILYVVRIDRLLKSLKIVRQLGLERRGQYWRLKISRTSRGPRCPYISWQEIYVNTKCWQTLTISSFHCPQLSLRWLTHTVSWSIFDLGMKSLC